MTLVSLYTARFETRAREANPENDLLEPLDLWPSVREEIHGQIASKHPLTREYAEFGLRTLAPNIVDIGSRISPDSRDGLPLTELANLERALGIPLPDDYRNFLRGRVPRSGFLVPRVEALECEDWGEEIQLAITPITCAYASILLSPKRPNHVWYHDDTVESSGKTFSEWLSDRTP